MIGYEKRNCEGKQASDQKTYLAKSQPLHHGRGSKGQREHAELNPQRRSVAQNSKPEERSNAGKKKEHEVEALLDYRERQSNRRGQTENHIDGVSKSLLIARFVGKRRIERAA